jgi:hypothetical protein
MSATKDIATIAAVAQLDLARSDENDLVCRMRMERYDGALLAMKIVLMKPDGACRAAGIGMETAAYLVLRAQVVRPRHRCAREQMDMTSRPGIGRADGLVEYQKDGPSLFVGDEVRLGAELDDHAASFAQRPSIDLDFAIQDINDPVGRLAPKTQNGPRSERVAKQMEWIARARQIGVAAHPAGSLSRRCDPDRSFEGHDLDSSHSSSPALRRRRGTPGQARSITAEGS